MIDVLWRALAVLGLVYLVLVALAFLAVGVALLGLALGWWSVRSLVQHQEQADPADAWKRGAAPIAPAVGRERKHRARGRRPRPIERPVPLATFGPSDQAAIVEAFRAHQREASP